MGLRFEAIAPSIADEENFFRTGPLFASLRTLATAKARSVAKANPDALVLGADTVVVLGKKVLGKPKNSDDARAMIGWLSGKPHSVLTAVALVCEECGFETSAIAETHVVFRDIPPQEIDDYVAGNDWRDKAGAYAIQGDALVFVDKIEGCYYNVMGLPVRTTIDCFTEYASLKGASLKGLSRKDSMHG
jgi:septum formation protein